MDISKFNKELGIKIARAKGLERNDNIKAAIELWLEISEMALRFSKSRNLDASFKNMIINRTQGIFKHVKNLKANQIMKEPFIEKKETLEANSLEKSPLEQNSHKSEIFLKPEAQKKNLIKHSPKKNDIINDSDLKNLPKGFKELKTSDQFKIITPHDEDYVEKHLSQDKTMRISSPKKEVETEEIHPIEEERLEFDQPENRDNLICFACGSENPISAKICKNCGISLN